MFRGAALSVFVAALVVILRRARGAREKAPIARLVVVAPLFVGTVASLVYPRAMVWASLDLPLWVRGAGLGAGILAVAGVYWVFTAFSRPSGGAAGAGPPRLVTNGPYRWVRHPMYLVMILLFVSLGLMVESWFILLYTGAIWLFLWLVAVPREDARLAAMFGEEYERYRNATGAFVPFVRVPGVRDGDPRGLR